MSKKVQIILLSTLGAIGAIFFVSVKQHLLYTKYIQMLLLKKTKYYSIYSNGKIEKASPFKIKQWMLIRQYYLIHISKTTKLV